MTAALPKKIEALPDQSRAALLLEISQGRLTIAQASQRLGVPFSEFEAWLDQSAAGATGRPEADARNITPLNDHSSKTLHAAYCRAMHELSARLALHRLPDQQTE